jgi:hypothetical protein
MDIRSILIGVCIGMAPRARPAHFEGDSELLKVAQEAEAH